MFPKIGVPQNGWFMMENPIEMDDLGVPLFLETPICFCFNLVVAVAVVARHHRREYCHLIFQETALLHPKCLTG